MKKLALISITFVFAGSVFAAETNMSKEDRQKMSDMHTKMATCLKSDKPMSECQKDMMGSCQKMMGKDGCPMMKDMGAMMGHGKMNHGTGN